MSLDIYSNKSLDIYLVKDVMGIIDTYLGIDKIGLKYSKCLKEYISNFTLCRVWDKSTKSKVGCYYVYVYKLILKRNFAMLYFEDVYQNYK